jgi:hypothetical protein
MLVFLTSSTFLVKQHMVRRYSTNQPCFLSSMNLSDLVSHLDSELRIAEIADYSNALNGLQLENHSRQGDQDRRGCGCDAARDAQGGRRRARIC